MKVLLTLLLFSNISIILSCLHSESINCSCKDNTIECIGSGENATEIQQLFINISSIHPFVNLDNLILNMTVLDIPTNFSLPDLKIRKLTLIGRLESFQESTFSEFFDLQVLEIQGNSIDLLGNHPFGALHNLTELYLDFNGIFQIKTDAFLNLNVLEVLSVSGNSLEEIEEEFFLNIPRLQNLTLNDNNITEISNIRGSLSTLKSLSVSNNYMKEYVEEKSLSGLSNLSYVDLSLNSLKGVKSHALSALINLLRLNLTKNVIESLDEYAFSKLGELQVLDLSENKISLIKTTAFNNLSSLKILNLSGNMLRAMLCDYTFDMHSLEHIDLSNNRIKTINAGTFLYSSNIQELFLAGNDLDEADAVICSPLQNITIGFIDIKFQTKNCDLPEPCGRSIEITTDETNDYDDYDTVTTPSPSTLTHSILQSSTFYHLTTFNTTEKIDDISNATNTEITTLPSLTTTTDPILNENSTTYVTTSYYSDSTETSSVKFTHITSQKSTVSDDDYDYDITTADYLSTSNSNLSTAASLPKISMPTISLYNYTIANDSLCLNWSINGTISTELVCSLRYASSKGRQSKHLECPKAGNNNECVEIGEIFEFCLMLYMNGERSDKACFTAYSSTSETSIPTTLFFTTTLEPETTFEAKTTVKPETTIEHDTTTSKPVNISYKPEISKTISAASTMNTPVKFKLTSFDIFFNASQKSILVLWTVNFDELESKCNLTLILLPNIIHSTKDNFKCSNSSHIITHLEMNEIEEICLASHHTLYGIETKCKKNVAILYGASVGKRQDHGYKNHSLFALSILLLVVLAVIIFIVVRSLLKKRSIKDRYNVYIEEQNVQKRTSTHNGPNVRYSYIQKE